MARRGSIATVCPHLVPEWNAVKNGKLLPYNVAARSSKRIWWRCKKGHEWQATPANRYAGTACPDCSKKRVSSQYNLATSYPHLADEWHPEKNKSLTPYDITPKSSRKVWWLCKKNKEHEWEAKIQNRVNSGRLRHGTGCPDCAGRRVSLKHNFAIQYPGLIIEWHPEKNGSLTPYNFTPKSNNEVWWLCKQNKSHEWKAKIQNRARGASCPYCVGRKASNGYNLGIMHPELIKEWNPEKNSKYFPHQFTPGSRFKAWWKCKRNHEWEAQIYSRAKGSGCPKCNPGTSKQEIRLFCEIRSIFPEAKLHDKIHGCQIDILLPKHRLIIEFDGWYWHKDRIDQDMKKNFKLKQKGFSVFRVRDERLSQDGIEFSITFNKNESSLETIKRALKFMVENFQFSSPEINLIHNYLPSKKYKNENEYKKIIVNLPGPIFEKSVANYPGLLKEWHYEKNILGPDQISYGSKIKVWWLCEYKHEWEATVGSRSSGRQCPQCSRKVSSLTNNLADCCPQLINEWHPIKNGNLTPNNFTPQSQKKFGGYVKKNMNGKQS